jgi:hypothetical protein
VLLLQKDVLRRYDASGKPLEEALVPQEALPGFFTSKKDTASPLNKSTGSPETDSAVPPADLDSSTFKPPHTPQNEVVHDLIDMTSSDPNTNAKCVKAVRENMEKKLVFDFIQPLCPSFLATDVVNNASFISAMAQTLPTIKDFIDLEKTYSTGQLKKANKSELFKNVDEIKRSLQVLNEKLQEASLIKIDASLGTERLCIVSAQKQMLLTGIITLTLKTSKLIGSGDVVRKMKKRIGQQKQRKSRPLTEFQQPETVLQCLNSELNWEEAFARLEANQVTCTKVHSGRIRETAAKIESCFVYQVSALETASTEEKDQMIKVLLTHFPIMRATRSDDKTKDVLINTRQLVMEPECFSILFSADDKSPEPSAANQHISHETPKAAVEGPTRRLGRQPFWIKFPGIIKTATAFIKQQSFAAHGRRRESTGTGTGVTLKDLRQHLLQNIPGLKEHGISRDTIHHLMVAPRKNSSRADRYKGHIDAKVTAKKNDYREGSLNQHFLFARVNYREELCSMFSDEARFYSSDDMNKLRMGPSH